jgi:DNA-binding NtrC family response regulator
LFLDEVDTLSAKAQIDLLRVLQEKRFRPLGSERDQETNVRIVAAANVPFDGLLQSGAFRADLYYRLCVFSIRLPPLRERKEDILLLAGHFLNKHAPAARADLTIAAEASAALESWNWPGNVRELENTIIRGIHLSSTSSIEIGDLRLPPMGVADSAGSPSTFKSQKREAIERFERDYLARLLAEHGGNVTRAAAAAQKERRDFGKLLKKYKLNPKAKVSRATDTGC